mgnify:CR=1 FL=1
MGRAKPEVPYRNLVLTGHIGAGKRAAGRVIAARLDAALIDIEAEIEAREGRTLQEIRELFGQARARALESALCRDLALRRSAVIVASSNVILNPDNRALLAADAEMLCLVCALDEVLRRLYVAMGARFHDPRERARIIARLKRERPLRQLAGLPVLDTTDLSVEQIADRAIAYWRRGVEALKPPASEAISA